MIEKWYLYSFLVCHFQTLLPFACRRWGPTGHHRSHRHTQTSQVWMKQLGDEKNEHRVYRRNTNQMAKLLRYLSISAFKSNVCNSRKIFADHLSSTSAEWCMCVCVVVAGDALASTTTILKCTYIVRT